MARDVSFKYQYLTGISAAQVARLRSSPAELSKFLAKNPGHGLNRYWQAVPYLITGRATGLKEPLVAGHSLAASRAAPSWSRPTPSPRRSRR